MTRTSQFNEDEIIKEIFDEIGEGGKKFVEFGCGKGTQNNTIALLRRGWSGVWCEPGKKKFEYAYGLWVGWPLTVRRRFVHPDKVNVIVKDPLDFLSIDIDGNDYHVWKAVTAKPRVVCIEVGDPRGVPLNKMNILARNKGYRLYKVGERGVNAFYIYEG